MTQAEIEYQNYLIMLAMQCGGTSRSRSRELVEVTALAAKSMDARVQRKRPESLSSTTA